LVGFSQPEKVDVRALKDDPPTKISETPQPGPSGPVLRGSDAAEIELQTSGSFFSSADAAQYGPEESWETGKLGNEEASTPGCRVQSARR